MTDRSDDDWGVLARIRRNRCPVREEIEGIAISCPGGYPKELGCLSRWSLFHICNADQKQTFQVPSLFSMMLAQREARLGNLKDCPGVRPLVLGLSWSCSSFEWWPILREGWQLTEYIRSIDKAETPENRRFHRGTLCKAFYLVPVQLFNSLEKARPTSWT